MSVEDVQDQMSISKSRVSLEVALKVASPLVEYVISRLYLIDAKAYYNKLVRLARHLCLEGQMALATSLQ